MQIDKERVIAWITDYINSTQPGDIPEEDEVLQIMLNTFNQMKECTFNATKKEVKNV